MPPSQSAFLVWLRHFVKHFEGEGLASVLFLCHEELSEPTGFHYLFQAFNHKKIYNKKIIIIKIKKIKNKKKIL